MQAEAGCRGMWRMQKGMDYMALLEFHNLIFVLPLAAAVLLVLLMGVGAPAGDHDVGHSIGDAFEHGVDSTSGHELDASHAGHLPMLQAVLTFMGIGNVPIMITLVSLGLLWGTAGLVSNGLLTRSSEHLGTVMLIAATAAIVGNALVSRVINRLLPSVESYGSHERELVTERGDVLHEITTAGGTVRTKDRHGNLRDVTVHAENSQDSIPRGSRVVLTDYVEEQGIFRARLDNPT